MDCVNEWDAVGGSSSVGYGIEWGVERCSYWVGSVLQRGTVSGSSLVGSGNELGAVRGLPLGGLCK